MQESVKQDRELYLGGSDISTIMEINPFKTRFDLLLEKAGYKEDTFEGNVFTEYGNDMESKIRDYISQTEGQTFEEGKHFKDIDGYTGLQIRAHTDGETDNMILEIKTTSMIHNSPEQYMNYLVQLLFYMMVNNRDMGILAVYHRPDDLDLTFDPKRLQTFMIPINAYPDICERINQAIKRFCEDLDKVKDNPFITEEDLLPSDITEIASQVLAFEQQLEAMKVIEKKIKSEKQRLKTVMETAGVKKWETPTGYKITLIPDQEDQLVEETSFNAERFMSENPDLWERYMETRKVIKKGRLGYVKITPPKESKT